MILCENIDWIELSADYISKMLNSPISINKEQVLVPLHPSEHQLQRTMQENVNVSKYLNYSWI